LYALLISPMCATCQTHPITLILHGEAYEAPHYVVFSSLLPLLSYVQIFSSAPCSETPSIYTPPLVWDVSHLYKTTGTIMILYILIKFWERRWEDRLWTEW
jgi:hypothetical protein